MMHTLLMPLKIMLACKAIYAMACGLFALERFCMLAVMLSVKGKWYDTLALAEVLASGRIDF